jgi:HSP20 family protein
MDMEKLRQWMEIAQGMQGGDFWKNVFDQDFAKQFINDQPFSAAFSNNGTGQTREDDKSSRTFPFIDILTSDEEVMVMIELPGVKKENIELGLAGDILTVKGTAMPIHPHLKLAYTERFYGEFQRQIKLPDQVHASGLSAKFWNGILFVSYLRTIEKGESIPID